MVEEWPSRLPTHHPHFSTGLDERQGIAALAPQFDQTYPSSRRSVPPIGSLSPQGRNFGPPLVSQNPNSDPFQTHAVLTPNPQEHHPPAALSPSVPAADFLDECNHAADAQNATSHSRHFNMPSDQPPHTANEFDLFGLASLDLGPPVFEPTPREAHSTFLSSPHARTAQLATRHRIPDLGKDHLHLDNQHRIRTSRSDFSIISPPQTQSILSHRTPAFNNNAPSPPPGRNLREQAHPTRCVLLRNIPPGIDDDDTRQLLQLYGPLRELGAQQRSRGGRGSVLATYFDLRHARTAVQALDASTHFGRRLDARFQCPADPQMAPLNTSIASAARHNSTSPSTNQGTLVVFNLDTSTSAEDIRSLFSTVGDVKEIRATPNKKHHKFVEFYDVRDAERAMHLLNKTEVAGKRIKIEISRPGGRANSLTRHVSAPAKVCANSAAIHHGRHPSTQQHVQYPQDGAAYRISSRHQSIDGPPSVHLNLSMLSPLNQAPQQSQAACFPQSSTDGPLDEHSSLSPHMFTSDTLEAPHPMSRSFDAAGTLSGSVDRRFSNPSISDDFDHGHMLSGFEGLSDSRGLQSNSDARGGDVRQLFAGHGAELPGFPSVSGPQQMGLKRGPESYIQALYNSPSSDDTRDVISPTIGASPRRASFRSVKSDATGSDAASAGIFRNGFGNGLHTHLEQSTSNGQHRKPTVGQIASISDRTFAQKQTAGKNGAHSGSGTCVGNKSFGNQHQNNSKYALDIRKVRSGEETRTALMIRNIPNKYNQKMLLSTLEERHKGHFDFIYLPIDFKNKCNVGYAFINFTKPEYIEPFYDAFHGKKWGRFNSEKVCEITFARIQGRQQLIAHFQNSSLLLEDPKCRPVIFDAKGRQEEFPIGSHVRTRRGPSSRDASHRTSETSPPYSPTKHRGRA